MIQTKENEISYYIAGAYVFFYDLINKKITKKIKGIPCEAYNNL